MGLEVSKRSIQIAQKALDVTNNNLNNIGTKGYTRQRLDQTSLYLRSYTNWQTKEARLSLGGQGSASLGVAQIRDNYIDKRYREMNCYAMQYQRTGDIMREVETTLDNVSNNGLMVSVQELTKALSETATNAADAREKSSIVRHAAENLCTTIRTYNTELEKLKQSNVSDLQAELDNVNTIIRKITDYNKSIVHEYAATEFGNVYNGISVSQYGPLEMMDERNVLLDELSGYANIFVEHENDGSVSVKIGNTTVVKGEQCEQILMREFEDFGGVVLNFTNGDPINNEIRAGVLESYIQVLNGNGPYASHYQTNDYGIPYYKSAIDAFANTLATLLNEVNGCRWVQDANAPGGFSYDSSRAMFAADTDIYTEVNGVRELVQRQPITASNIRISDEWMANETMIGQVFVGPDDAIEAKFTAAAWLMNADGTYEYDADGRMIPDTDKVPNMVTADAQGYALDKNGERILDVAALNLKNPVEPLYYMKDEMNGRYYVYNSDYKRINSFGDAVPESYAEGYYSQTNLDGANLNKLLLAFTDKSIKFGRASDFTGSAIEYLQFLSNRTAESISYLDSQCELYTDAANRLLDNRDGVSGVSDTEEGVNMLTYQKWFNASARMMTALDECLDKVINGMGRVGL